MAGSCTSNGYRSWRENRDVCLLAHTWRLPIVSGGDRHGRAPNSLLNLTRARTFGRMISAAIALAAAGAFGMAEGAEPTTLRGHRTAVADVE